MLIEKHWAVSIQKLPQIMLSPITLVACTIGGILFGMLQPGASKDIAILGEVYVNFLKLLAIPFLISALASSIANLTMGQRETNAISLKFAVLLLVGMLVLCSGLVYAAGSIFIRPSSQMISMEKLDELMHSDQEGMTERSIKLFSDPPKQATMAFSAREFVLKSLPTNVFQSLYHGDSLHILIVAILFGMALGVLQQDLARNTILMLSSIFQACVQLIHWSIYFLPVCIFCLLANAVAKMAGTMLELLSLFLVMHLGFAIFEIILAFWMWSRAAHVPVFRHLKLQGKALLMGLCAGRSIVVLPIIMQNMERNLLYNGEQLKLLLPFSFTLGKFAQTTQMVLTVLFIANLYGTKIAIPAVIAIILLAPATCVGGAWPMVIAVPLKILSLPDELAILLMLSISPFINPFGTLQNVLFNCLFVSLSLKQRRPVRQAAPSIPAAVEES